jgi:hypothetical protein
MDRGSRSRSPLALLKMSMPHAPDLSLQCIDVTENPKFSYATAIRREERGTAPGDSMTSPQHSEKPTAVDTSAMRTTRVSVERPSTQCLPGTNGRKGKHASEKKHDQSFDRLTADGLAMEDFVNLLSSRFQNLL